MNEEIKEVPELKGVKMLVSTNGASWDVERDVLGSLNGRFIALNPYNRGSVTMWPHAKPLPLPHETPPEGYRLVTDEERAEYNKPSSYMCIIPNDRNDSWELFENGCETFACGAAYAVPLSFTFEAVVKEMTMAEINKALGYSVKVTE